jgi:HK97 family phage portal protein
VKLSSLFNFKQKDAGMPQDFYFGGGAKSSITLNTSQDFLNAYQTINYVGKCAYILAGDIARLKWQTVDLNGKVKENKEFLEVINNPLDDNLNYCEFITMLGLHLILDGNAFVLLDSDNLFSAKNKKPSSLKLLNPAITDVVSRGQIIRSTDVKNFYKVDYYQVNIHNTTWQLKSDMVCQLKITSPHNVLRGMGIIQKNLPTIEVDKAQTAFNTAFFQRGGTANLIIKTIDLNPSAFELFRKKFKEKYLGANNLFEPYFLNGKDADITPLNLSQRDSQFLEQKKLTREDIRGMFGVPSIISGDENAVRYNSSDAQLSAYREITLPRYYSIIEDGLTKILKIFDKNLKFEFIKEKTIDLQKQSQVVATLFDRGILTGNESRQLLGLDIVIDKELDKRYISANLIEAGYVAPVETSKPVEPAKGMAKHSHKRLNAKQNEIIKQAKLAKAKLEPMIVQEVNKFYVDLEKQVLKAFDNEVKAINDIIDLEPITNEAKKASKRFFTSGVTVAINNNNKILGGKVDSSFKNPKIRLVVDKLGTKYADLTIETRKNEVLNIIKQGFEDGLANSEIKGLLQDNFDSLTGPDSWKAWRIARTEASNAYDQGSLMVYEDVGVKFVDVVGCEDTVTDCNKTDIPMNEAWALEFHPNHTGDIVPQI